MSVVSSAAICVINRAKLCAPIVASCIVIVMALKTSPMNAMKAAKKATKVSTSPMKAMKVATSPMKAMKTAMRASTAIKPDVLAVAPADPSTPVKARTTRQGCTPVKFRREVFEDGSPARSTIEFAHYLAKC